MPRVQPAACLLLLCLRLVTTTSDCIITVAGQPGVPGAVGNGGPATSATLYFPNSVTLDNDDLLVADYFNAVVRRVSSTGVISTVVGQIGGSYTAAEGAPATLATLRGPHGIAVDADGLLIVDFTTHAIRRVNASGTIRTVAGLLGVSGSTGDGGTAAAARLFDPHAAIPDGAAGFWIADSGNHAVRRVLANGSIFTVAGQIGLRGATGNGVAATTARLNYPTHVGRDGAGFYVADASNHVIRRVLGNGTIVTVAGQLGLPGASGSGGAATAARLNYPSCVEADGVGGFYVADRNNHAVRRVLGNGTIVTVAGQLGLSGASGSGGAATAARLNSPAWIALDGIGGFYIADRSNHAIRRVLPTALCSGGGVANCSWVNASTFHCFLVDLPPAALMSVTADARPCSTVRPLNVHRGGSVVYACTPASQVSTMLRWSSQLQQVNASMLLAAVSIAFPDAQHEIALGRPLTFLINATILSAVAVHDVVLLTDDSRAALPCANTTIEATEAPLGNITCGLLLWHDAWYSRNLSLSLRFGDALQPTRMRLQLPDHVTLPRPRLSVIQPVIAYPGDQVIAMLPTRVPSAIHLGPLARFPSGCTCNGTSSSLRGWVGAQAAPCQWLNVSAVSCTMPAWTPVSLAARLTLEVCCVYNVTSDGAAPEIDAVNVTSPSALAVLYHPSIAFTGFQPAVSPSLLAQAGSARNVSISVPASVMSALAIVADAAWLGNSSCAGLEWNFIESSLVCSLWGLGMFVDEYSPSNDGRLQLPLDLRLRGMRVRTVMVDATLLPVVRGVSPSNITAGACMAVLGSYLTGDNAATTRVYLGDLSLRCRDSGSTATASYVECCTPSVIPVITTGYPLLRVFVVNNRGVSVEPVAVRITIDARASWTDTRTSMALPCPFGPSEVLQAPFQLRPAMELQVSGEAEVSCSLLAAVTSCSRTGDTSISILGPSPAVIAMPSNATRTSMQLLAVGVRSRLGCTAMINASCTDSLSRLAVTPTSRVVQLGDVNIVWNESAPRAIYALPASTLPALHALLVPDGIARAAAAGNITLLAALFSCTGGVGPTGISTTSGTPLLAHPAFLTTSPCSVSEAAEGGNMSVMCSNVVLPVSAVLGTQYFFFLECIYTPASEVLPAAALWRVQVLSVDLLLALGATDSSGIVDAYAPVALRAHLSFPNASACASTPQLSGMACSELSFERARGSCALRLVAASSSLISIGDPTRHDVRSDGYLATPGLNVSLLGPPFASTGVQLVCTVWDGQEVRSNVLMVTLASYRTRWVDTLSRHVLPSSRTDVTHPIEPALAVLSNAWRALACTVSIVPNTVMCPPSTFTAHGFGFGAAPAAPRLIGDVTVTVEDLDDTQLNATLAIRSLGVSAGSGCSMQLSATCRDGASRSNTTEMSVIVALPRFRGEWSLAIETLAALRRILPSVLPTLNITLFTDMPMATGSASWSCIGVLLPASFNVSTSTALASVAREGVSDSVAQLHDETDGNITAVLADANVGRAVLGSSLMLHAECVWLPTTERVRLPPLPVDVMNVSFVVLDAATGSQLSEITVLAHSGIRASLLVELACAESTSPVQVYMPPMSCSWNVVKRTSSSLIVGGGAFFDLAGRNVTTSAREAYALPLFEVIGPPLQSMTVLLQCSAWERAVYANPIIFTTAAMVISPLSALPVQLIPSDVGARWLLPQRVVVGVRAGSAADSPFLTGGAVACSLTMDASDTDGGTLQTQLIPQNASTLSAAYTGVFADSTGKIAFPYFALRSGFDRHNVSLTVACTRPAYGDAPPPLHWSLSVLPLHARLCSSSQLVSSAQTPFRVTATLAETCASARWLPASLSPPAVLCTVDADDPSVLLQDARTSVASNGSIDFPALSVTAPPGQTYLLRVRCTVGSIPTQPVEGLSMRVDLVGCRPGTQVSGSFCQPCASDEFALGGSTLSRCDRCPSQGAVCTAGIIALLPRFYRPHRLWGAPIDSSSQLLPCFNSEACTLNASTMLHGCSDGYTGPLCGVCDAERGYARMGAVCAACGDLRMQQALLAFVVLAALAAITYVALRKDSGGRTDASIVLKITMSYLQAVGSLRSLKVGGTKAYHDVMGWTDAVSENPLSLSSLQCILRPPFAAQYGLTVLLPAFVSMAVILVFIIANFIRSVHWRRMVCHGRRSLLTRNVAILSMSGDDVARGVADSSIAVIDTETLTSRVKAWWAERRHVATFVFVLFLTYMTVISASLRVLDCYTPAIDGVTYLRADLTIVCYEGQHIAMSVFACCTLVAVGLGFPGWLLWRLAFASDAELADPQFHGAWGFLYDGYRGAKHAVRDTPRCNASSAPRARVLTSMDAVGRAAHVSPASPPLGATMMHTPRHVLSRIKHGHLMWWEAVVLLRKAGIVLLAVLVTNPYTQTSFVILWLVAAFGLQLYFQPYARSLFNTLELLSLIAGILTAALSNMLLQYYADNPFFALQAPATMTPEEWGITSAVLLINLTMLAALSSTWVVLQIRTCRDSASTIKVSGGLLLRTFTSPYQSRGGRTGVSRPIKIDQGLVHVVNPLLVAEPPKTPGSNRGAR